MKYLKIFFLLIAFLTSSCKNADKPHRVTCKSFVLSYRFLESLSLGEQDFEGEKSLQLFGNSPQNRFDTDVIYTERDGAEIYWELCRKHNDLTYNHTVLMYPEDSYIGRQLFLAEDFVSVDIWSDSDYDEDHSAGTSLANIVRFVSLSSYQFIRNGYAAYDWASSDVKELYTKLYGSTIDSNNGTTSGPGGFYPLNKLVSDLQLDDLKIFGPAGKYSPWDKSEPLAYLFFEHPSTLSKTHTFTVTLTTDDGKVFEDTITVTFE